MARDIDSQTGAHFAGQQVTPIVLVQAQFDSGDLNIWGGYGDVEWGGDTYKGAGDLLQLRPAKETREIRANGMTFSLSGIPSDIIATALTEPYQERPIFAWLGALASDGTLLPPYPFFRGRMDQMNIEEGGETASIDLTAENRLIDLQRPKTRRYTQEDQQDRFPDDEGLSQVTSLNDGRSIVWGR
jgi:hypothetical protein